MRWAYQQVQEGGDPLPCSVCDRSFPDPSIICGDIIFYPDVASVSAYQHRWIERIWGVDPFSDFNVCHECLDGHYNGVNPGLTADVWLDDQIAHYKFVDRYRRMGVVLIDPSRHPADSRYRCLDCGLAFSPDAKRVRGCWRCPTGCNKGRYSPG